MRFSMIVLAVSVITPVAGGLMRMANPQIAMPLSATANCGTTSPTDSLRILESLQNLVSGPIVAFRTSSGLPSLSADQVAFGGSAIQCDSVSARYQRLRTLETGMQWPKLPVIMVRIGPSHWVADPQVLDQYGQREWIILDSLLNITKIWRTFGDG